MVDADGSHLRVLTHDKATETFTRLTYAASCATDPVWSPDGHWIVFVAGGYVKEIRPDGTGIRHILYVNGQNGWNFQPDW